MESTTDESAIERFLERGGEGLFSITFEVDDVVTEMARMSPRSGLGEQDRRGP